MSIMRQQVNLLNAIPKAEQKIMPGVAIYWTWVGFLGLMLLISGYGYQQLVKSRRQVVQLKAEQAEADSQVNALMEQKDKLKNEQELANAIISMEQSLKKKQDVLATLEEIHSAQTQENFSKIFHALSTIYLPTVWLTDFTLLHGGTDLELQGMARRVDSVTEYLEQINKMSIFSDKEFTVLELHKNNKQKKVSFLIGTKPKDKHGS